MDLTKLLLSPAAERPYFREKKDKITFFIKIQKDALFDAKDLIYIQKRLYYIFKNKELYRKRINLHVDIHFSNFADKTVVILLELMLFCFSQRINIRLYLNCQAIDTNAAIYNFFVFSFLYKINKQSISSEIYCSQYEKFRGINVSEVFRGIDNHTVTCHYRKYIDEQEIKDNAKKLVMPSTISSDINTLLKGILVDKKIRNEICGMIEELVDNIFSHTNGVGLVDLAICPVKSNVSKNYHTQFMINVINISNNFLFSEIKSSFADKNLYLGNRSIISEAHDNQKLFFEDEDYSEQLFFMVAAFQRGTTTRSAERQGGTGLNNTILNFLKRSQTNVPKETSYVYSGNDILLFNHDILNNSKIGPHIAFNEENDFNKKPNSKCLSKSLFFLNGTAYNLMFIV